MVEQQRALGLDLEFLPDNDRVRAIAPAISREVLAASLCPTDGHANPLKATTAFADDARRHGAEIREGVAVRSLLVRGDRVAGVETNDGTHDADCVIVAAGINTPRLLRSAGLDLPLSIKVVHVVQTGPLPPMLAQVFGVANADCAGRQEVDGRLRFTSGAEDWLGDPDRWDERELAPGDDDVRRVVDRVAHVLPVVATTPIHRTWGGLIDLTPDALPAIDSPLPGLVVAAGFSGHGFCLGPASGQLCADLALGRAPRHDLSAFRLDRFRDVSARADLTLHG
jgi:sarcosine oxidase subunit beta